MLVIRFYTSSDFIRNFHIKATAYAKNDSFPQNEIKNINNEKRDYMKLHSKFVS